MLLRKRHLSKDLRRWSEEPCRSGEECAGRGNIWCKPWGQSVFGVFKRLQEAGKARKSEGCGEHSHLRGRKSQALGGFCSEMRSRWSFWANCDVIWFTLWMPWQEIKAKNEWEDNLGGSQWSRQELIIESWGGRLGREVEWGATAYGLGVSF